MEQTIGWIGTGVMGESMCTHILNAGYEVFIYNRTKNKASELIKKGAKWCNNPGDVANKSNYIFTIVGFPEDVKEIYFGAKGIIENLNKDTITIDMTTSTPSLAKTIFNKISQAGSSSLDAPVSGGDIGAKNGKLAIMAGGQKDIFIKTLPLFNLMGENIKYMGNAGSGQSTKMCNQILIASTMIGVVESLLYAQKSGLNPEEVINVIGKGAAASWSINNMGPRICKKDMSPGFYIKHFVKDMGIALEEAKNMKICLPGLALANQFYISAMAMGMEDLGTQGLFRVLENLNKPG